MPAIGGSRVTTESHHKISLLQGIYEVEEDAKELPLSKMEKERNQAVVEHRLYGAHGACAYHHSHMAVEPGLFEHAHTTTTIYIV